MINLATGLKNCNKTQMSSRYKKSPLESIFADSLTILRCCMMRKGKSIKCPLLDYDAVVGCKAFGNIDGKEYFIVKAFQWCIETKMDFIVFDIDGKQKAMREIIGKPKYRIDDLLRDEKDSLIRDIREVEREQRKLSESDRGNRPGRHF